jgi:hypothetical protein
VLRMSKSGELLHIFLLNQNTNNKYDTYESAVVIAKNEEEARLIHPDGNIFTFKREWDMRSWVSPDQVKVQLVGVAGHNWQEGDVVIANYHSG